MATAAGIFFQNSVVKKLFLAKVKIYCFNKENYPQKILFWVIMYQRWHLARISTLNKNLPLYQGAGGVLPN